MPKRIDWNKFRSALLEQLDKPYKFGAKWPLGDPNPQGPLDCSSLSRWAYSRVGIYIPEGSTAQFLASHPVDIAALGDLGFFRNDKGIHHVGILLGDEVIDARGDPYNKVITRPRAKWEAWKEFTGWHRPDAVTKFELA